MLIFSRYRGDAVVIDGGMMRITVNDIYPDRSVLLDVTCFGYTESYYLAWGDRLEVYPGIDVINDISHRTSARKIVLGFEAPRGVQIDRAERRDARVLPSLRRR